MKILLSGSSGLIGSMLTTFLESKNHQIIKLVRKDTDVHEDEIAWDLHKGIVNLKKMENLDAVIHLAGENVSNGRWTEEKKKSILDSRVMGTLVLCRAIASLKNPPKVLISASAIGYYGSRGDEILTEESSQGAGFLADLCEQWEAATLPAREKGIRVVTLRLGMVLTPKGGALKKMLIPFKLGLGGIIGSGKQYVSWIAMDDLLRMIEYTLQKESIQGPVNAVSPHPVTNQELTKTLGQLLHRPTIMWIPEFAARIAFGEMADELLLNSLRVLPKKVTDAGFQYAAASLKCALEGLLDP